MPYRPTPNPQLRLRQLTELRSTATSYWAAAACSVRCRPPRLGVRRNQLPGAGERHMVVSASIPGHLLCEGLLNRRRGAEGSPRTATPRFIVSEGQQPTGSTSRQNDRGDGSDRSPIEGSKPVHQVALPARYGQPGPGQGPDGSRLLNRPYLQDLLRLGEPRPDAPPPWNNSDLDPASNRSCPRSA